MLNMKKLFTKTLDRTTWKAFPSTRTGIGAIDLSSISGKYEELLVEVWINGSYNRQFFLFPVEALAEDVYIYSRQGGYGSSMAGTSAYVVVGARRNSVMLSDAFLFGTNHGSTSVLRVFYR